VVTLHSRGRNLVETAGTLGKRFGAQKKFGLLVGGTYDWNGRGIDDIEPVPDIARSRVGQPLAILRLSTFVNIVTTAAVGTGRVRRLQTGHGSNLPA